MPKVRVLVSQEPSEFLDECHKTKLPGIISWNSIKMAYRLFKSKYRGQVFENFDCLTGAGLLLFSLLCVFHHHNVGRIQLDSVSVSIIEQKKQSKKYPRTFPNKEGLLGNVWIGNTNQPIHVPSNSALTIPGKTSKVTKIPSGTPCLIDMAAHHYLPQGVL